MNIRFSRLINGEGIKYNATAGVSLSYTRGYNRDSLGND